ENGEALYDSAVIVEYLDALAGGGRIIPLGWGRFDALRRQALGDGLMDAAILTVYEGRWRPAERHEPRWLEHQAGKMDRALVAAGAGLGRAPERIDVGDIALACGLGYLDLRLQGRWREGHPKLATWLTGFEARVPAFAQTRAVL